MDVVGGMELVIVGFWRFLVCFFVESGFCVLVTDCEAGRDDAILILIRKRDFIFLLVICRCEGKSSSKVRIWGFPSMFRYDMIGNVSVAVDEDMLAGSSSKWQD